MNITIEQALAQEPKLKALADEDARVGKLIEVAKALEGLPRHASTHAAGVVISNKALVEYLPLYKGPKENIITTQYPMKDVENIGLVKFDFLGLKTLTVIDRALKLVKSRTGISRLTSRPSRYRRPRRPTTLIAASNTNGVFQLESSGMKDLLRKLKPDCIRGLDSRRCALQAGTALQSGMVDDFIKRRHGRNSRKVRDTAAQGPSLRTPTASWSTRSRLWRSPRCSRTSRRATPTSSERLWARSSPTRWWCRGRSS